MTRRLLSLALILALLTLTAPASAEEEARISLPEISFADQYGRVWTNADFEGKVVFLNFWTTWCPWCVREMPDIEALYHELGENEGDVLIFGIDTPDVLDNVDLAGITAFLEENGFTYPTLIDPEARLCGWLGIGAFPTTFIIRPDGTILGYLAGAIGIDTMRAIIDMGRTE